MAGSENLTFSPPACVVSDTTALTTLMKCDLDWLLPRLFEHVLIPFAVSRELLAFHPALPVWCEVRDSPTSDLLKRLRECLDAGESEAIVLAITEKAHALLIDEKDGRDEAEALGLKCLTLSDVLVAARSLSLIPSLAGAFATLAERGRYRVADQTARESLEAVGEAAD